MFIYLVVKKMEILEFASAGVSSVASTRRSVATMFMSSAQLAMIYNLLPPFGHVVCFVGKAGFIDLLGVTSWKQVRAVDVNGSTVTISRSGVFARSTIMVRNKHDGRKIVELFLNSKKRA